MRTRLLIVFDLRKRVRVRVFQFFLNTNGLKRVCAARAEQEQPL